MLETVIKWALIIAGAYLVVRVGLRLWRKYHAQPAEATAAPGAPLNGEPDNSPIRNTLGPVTVSNDGGPVGVTGYRYGGYAEAGAKTQLVLVATPGGFAPYHRDYVDAERRQYFRRRV